MCRIFIQIVNYDRAFKKKSKKSDLVLFDSLVLFYYSLTLLYVWIESTYLVLSFAACEVIHLCQPPLTYTHVHCLLQPYMS